MATEFERLCENVSIQSTEATPRRHVGTGLRGGYDGSDWPYGSTHWKCKLRYRGRQITTEFHQGPAISAEPTAAEVLSCLIMDVSAGETEFSEFLSEFGYDVDYESGNTNEKLIWNACRKMAPKVRRFLGEEFERFVEADQ